MLGGGYCRSEAVCSIFLQKRRHARRIYAHIVHVKINCDGFKAEGITYPSHVMQKQLLKEFYEECQVLPETVDWIELHATGTRVRYFTEWISATPGKFSRRDAKIVKFYYCEMKLEIISLPKVRILNGLGFSKMMLSNRAKGLGFKGS